MSFDELLEINNKKLSKQYIESLSKDERIALIDPIFNLLRSIGWIYPDDKSKITKEYKRLIDFQPDLSKNDIFNNSSLATYISKYFCHKFYLATTKNKPTMIDNFNNDGLLKKLIKNRLGLDWIDSNEKGPGVNEAFNLSFKMFIQGQRSMRMVSQISIFKPDVAKYLCMKYSNDGDTIFDYSAGFGARMLGAASCNRKYIGVDPWTIDELENMKNYLNLKDVSLIKNGSENVKLEENSIDFSYSSPPYYDQEVYSNESSQAYSQGEDHFYNVYWRKTLENIKFMLKPNKFFGLNVVNFPKMVDIAKEYFGEPVEEIKLRTVRSHLTKGKANKLAPEKYEPVYIFKNEK